MAMQREQRQYFGIYGEITENEEMGQTLIGKILTHKVSKK
jgi:hypothetical protein